MGGDANVGCEWQYLEHRKQISTHGCTPAQRECSTVMVTIWPVSVNMVNVNFVIHAKSFTNKAYSRALLLKCSFWDHHLGEGRRNAKWTRYFERPEMESAHLQCQKSSSSVEINRRCLAW